jgi:hypothetical protein
MHCWSPDPTPSNHRSTVSKVLRQKDKYLSIRPKGEPPDVNFGICNWARRRISKTGLIPTDEEIKNHGIKLGTIIGSAALEMINDFSWLKNIKQETNIPDSGICGQGSLGSSLRRHLASSPAVCKVFTDTVGWSFSGSSVVLPPETAHGLFTPVLCPTLRTHVVEPTTNAR